MDLITSLSTITSLAISLFLLMDPIGNVPIFLAILKDLPRSRQRFIIFRELLIALFVIILFAYIGEYLLDLLHITQSTLMISGGIILFLIALRMIFPEPDGEKIKKNLTKEPFIVPLAIPMIAGPSVLAAVMIYSHSSESSWVLVSAICLAWLISALILLASSSLREVLGERGLMACERLMGLVLTLISVQMFLEGVSLFWKKISG